MFDFEPNFDFNLKKLNIKKSFFDTIKSKPFKRFLVVFILIVIYTSIFCVAFILLNISLEVKSSGTIDGVEQFEMRPVSPYLNSYITSIIALLLPVGVILIIISYFFRYKKIDDIYFHTNKKTYKAKVIVLPNKKKFAKQKSNFTCVEVLINENDKKNPIALIELPYIVEDENTEITIEYLYENNEARLPLETK